MKRQTALTILIVALTGLKAAPATADTVMLYLREADDSTYFELAGIDLAAAVEDGVLAEFFEEGHIIFNYGLPPEDPEEAPFVTQAAPVRVAKTGGASLLLEIMLSDPVDDQRVPASVGYVFRDIILDQEISRGTVGVDDFAGRDLTDPRALCVEIGKTVARMALSR